MLAVCLAGALVAAKVDLNNPTGKTGVMMVDKLGAHVRFFDPATWKETGNIEMGVNPHDFVVTADHKTAYIPIYGDGVYGKNPHPGHEVAIRDDHGRLETARDRRAIRGDAARVSGDAESRARVLGHDAL